MMTREELEKMRKEHWMHGIEDLLQIIWAKDGQIATLKTALRHALFSQKWTGARGIEPEDIERQVAAQLARQYPEIFGGKE